MTYDRSTTHLKFNPTRVRTHDLEIMIVHFMSLPFRSPLLLLVTFYNKMNTFQDEILDQKDFKEIGPLSCTSPRKFWISWAQDKITVGTEEPFLGEMLQADNAYQVDVVAIAMATGHGSTGQWVMDSQQSKWKPTVTQNPHSTRLTNSLQCIVHCASGSCFCGDHMRDEHMFN